MKLRVKEMQISTGGPLIAILNTEDAALLDLHHGDRIRVKRGKRALVVKVDITRKRSIVKPGHLGLLDEGFVKLNLKKGQEVSIGHAEKPKSITFIREKLDGKKLSARKITQIVSDIVNNELDDVELTYFVSASHTQLMDHEETVNLTKAMIRTGDVLRFEKKPIVDKHCIGGVAGNRTTMIVVPIVTAAGLTVPKTSSRSITSPSGTADTMECIADVSFPIEKIKDVVKHTGACMVWGGAINLAPADDRIIRVEHPVSIDSRSQLIASILAKKASVSATHVLVDIPVGKGAKIESIHNAVTLKEQFETIGKRIGMRILTVITDGSKPIGKGFGPMLEAKDVLYVLRNDERAPWDLKEKSIVLAGKILEMTKTAGKGQGRKLARKLLETGRAFEKFSQVAKAQGVHTLDPSKLKEGKYKRIIRAAHGGTVRHIDNMAVSKIARIAGAPRDKSAGLLLHIDRYDLVKKGQPLFTIYSNNRQRLGFALNAAKEFEAMTIRK